MYTSQRSIPPIEELLPILERECKCNTSTELPFQFHFEDRLSIKDVGEMYSTLRLGGVSTRQVEDVVAKICVNDNGWARKSKTGDIFKELDRRYFIVENARWEFSMLDLTNKGEISESEAKTLFKTVQGNRYLGAWKLFMNRRANPGSKVKWEEVEVPLCEILREKDVDSGTVRGSSVAFVPTTEEIKPSHKEKEVNTEVQVHEAFEQVEKAQKTLVEAEEKLKSAKTDDDKKTAEELKQTCLRDIDSKKTLAHQLKLQDAIRSGSLAKLTSELMTIKEERISGCSTLVNEAEHLVKKLQAAEILEKAITSRKISELSDALNTVVVGGWRKEYAESCSKAETTLEKLRRLEQRKKAVLELSQRVIAELKSYSQPPVLVHQVMIATFLLLGSPERETKSWQATQILIGKTGKSSLKRRVAECDPCNITGAIAQRVADILGQYEYTTVQDTSLGCAVFYSWAEDMVEEVRSVSKT